MKQIIVENFGLLLFISCGFIGVTLLNKLLKIVSQLNEFADRLATLISITYEATHNPNIKLNVTKQVNGKD